MTAGQVASLPAKTNQLAELTRLTISDLKEQLKSAAPKDRQDALMNFWNLPTTVTEAENPALTEALPILLQAATDQDSHGSQLCGRCFAKNQIFASAGGENVGTFSARRNRSEFSHGRSHGFEGNRQPAAPAVPDLIHDLENRNDDGTFISATEGPVEPNVSLGTALRRAVIEALGNIGAPAQDAVPILRKRLNDTGSFSLGNRVFWVLPESSSLRIAVARC